MTLSLHITTAELSAIQTTMDDYAELLHIIKPELTFMNKCKIVLGQTVVKSSRLYNFSLNNQGLTFNVNLPENEIIEFYQAYSIVLKDLQTPAKLLIECIKLLNAKWALMPTPRILLP